MRSLLFSHYVVDGVQKELSPADMLDAVLEVPIQQDQEEPSVIVDETLDPVFSVSAAPVMDIRSCTESVEDMARVFPLPYAAEYTRAQIAVALLDSIWRKGNFKLEDLPVTAKWIWNDDRVGSAAAFYQSVEAAADYLENLNIGLRRYCVSNGEVSVRFATPFSGAPLVAGDRLLPDSHSWIVYVPFDTSEYRLGGSLLSQAIGVGGAAPQVCDPDYFMDCYEVVREFVVDGVALSGVTVGDGGLMAALRTLTAGGVGADIDISDVLKAYEEKDPVRILFSEVPGVVLQVSDIDFDYIDAEFLLQDVAFFPLGHPSVGGDLHVKSSVKTGIQTILESLMQNAEGED